MTEVLHCIFLLPARLRKSVLLCFVKTEICQMFCILGLCVFEANSGYNVLFPSPPKSERHCWKGNPQMGIPVSQLRCAGIVKSEPQSQRAERQGDSMCLMSCSHVWKQTLFDKNNAAKREEANGRGDGAKSEDPKKEPSKKEAPKKMSVERVYQKKTQLEHILLRPDTYIGSVEPVTQVRRLQSLSRCGFGVKRSWRLLQSLPSHLGSGLRLLIIS